MAISHAHFARECADRESSLSQETRHFLHERTIGERSIHSRRIGGPADRKIGTVAVHMDSIDAATPRNRSAWFLRNKADRHPVTAAVILLVIGTSIWVGFDSRSRDWSHSSFANKPWQ